MPSAVVVGANGFIGGVLTRLLDSKGWSVRTVDLTERSSELSGLPHVGTHSIVDVTSPETLRGVFDGSDCVFNLAAVVGTGGAYDVMRAVNVAGPVNVIAEAERAGAKTVHVASTAALGPTPPGVDCDESFVGAPTTAYAITKRAGLEAVRQVSGDGASVVVVLPCAVFGAEGVDGFNLSAPMAMFAKRRIPIYAPGCIRVGAVHVDDVAEGMVLAALNGRVGQEYVLADRIVSLEDLFAMVCGMVGRRRPVSIGGQGLRRLTPLVRQVAKLAEDPARIYEAYDLTFTHAAFSGTKAKVELGWEPEILERRVSQFVTSVVARQAEALAYKETLALGLPGDLGRHPGR